MKSLVRLVQVPAWLTVEKRREHPKMTAENCMVENTKGLVTLCKAAARSGRRCVSAEARKVINTLIPGDGVKDECSLNGLPASLAKADFRLQTDE
jgi:hypothetical protein